MKDQVMMDKVIENKIYFIFSQKVMLDRDLADLYAVETKRLKEQVRRNIERFPEKYMFTMNEEEFADWRSHFATSNDKQGLRYAPFCFTEQGILQLSNVLKSQKAIQVSFMIIDVFVRLRETLSNHSEVWLQIEKIKSRLGNQDKNIELLFHYLDEVISMKKETENRQRIGFKPDNLY